MNPSPCRPVWGVNIIPTPAYASYTTEKTESGMEYQAPVGEPLYYEWQALLDPADTPLPDWITEVVEESTLLDGFQDFTEEE
jgi:hypothetical protein